MSSAAAGGPLSGVEPIGKAASHHAVAAATNGIGAGRHDHNSTAQRGGGGGGSSSSGSSAGDLGVTWCRRAARAVKQRLLDNQQLFREYQYVVALDDTIRHTQGDALRADSVSRNRYANVLPYDYNRCAVGGWALIMCVVNAGSSQRADFGQSVCLC